MANGMVIGLGVEEVRLVLPVQTGRRKTPVLVSQYSVNVVPGGRLGSGRLSRVSLQGLFDEPGLAVSVAVVQHETPARSAG